MLPYARIAGVLEEIGSASRVDKADIACGFLSELEMDLICPTVRLLTGALWPSWRLKEMGIGQETLIDVIADISLEDVWLLRGTIGEMGTIAEIALKCKSQELLCPEALDALSVYKRLEHISNQTGPGSDYRKAAILRGLLLEASPLEGKYIARTMIGSPLTGLGPKTMISAISLAFDCDYNLVRRAYSFMSELGMLALAAAERKLDEISIKPPRPVRQMLIRPGKTVLPGAYHPRYPGLRVQIHGIKNVFHAYTARLRNITPALAGMFRDMNIEHDFVAEAELIGFQDGRMLDQTDIVRYINRRHLSRRSATSPCLIVYDLLYIDGEDLTKNCYEERRRCLVSVFGVPKGLPFRGLSTAEEMVLECEEDVGGYYRQSIGIGARGLIGHDLYAPYTPGEYGSDVLVRSAEETKMQGLLTKYA